MNPQHEVLVLRDCNVNDFWYISPEIHDLIGWWPDGTPAWACELEYPEGNRIVVGVIPKRQPVGESWLEDSPAVRKLIDMAVILNDVFSPMRGSMLAAAYSTGDLAERADAMLARIGKRFVEEDDVEEVLMVMRKLIALRRQAASSATQ